MSLAERYKQARKLAGYSQGELAELTHSTATSISKIERGLVSSPRHLDIHAKHLGVSEAFLRFGTDEDSITPVMHSPQYQALSRDLRRLEREGLLQGEVFQVLKGAMSLVSHSQPHQQTS